MIDMGQYQYDIDIIYRICWIPPQCVTHVTAACMSIIVIYNSTCYTDRFISLFVIHKSIFLLPYALSDIFHFAPNWYKSKNLNTMLWIFGRCSILININLMRILWYQDIIRFFMWCWYLLHFNWLNEDGKYIIVIFYGVIVYIWCELMFTSTAAVNITCILKWVLSIDTANIYIFERLA
jgi:hypothetical protein